MSSKTQADKPRDAALPERTPVAATPIADLMQARPRTTDRPAEEDLPLLERITARAFAQTMQMIHVANHRARTSAPAIPRWAGTRPPARARCTSSPRCTCVVREPQDYVCCKPHASPVDHSLHHLMRLFRRDRTTPGSRTPRRSQAMTLPAQVRRRRSAGRLPELPRAHATRTRSTSCPRARSASRRWSRSTWRWPTATPRDHGWSGARRTRTSGR